MRDPNFDIRTMTLDEVKLAVDWAGREGWNPGLHDAEVFHATDPNGWFIGYLGDEPIACISAVAYDEHFGFGGFYIVKPEYRHQWYGYSIYEHGMKYFGDRNVGGDGVVEQQENYKKSGFKYAYRNIRFQGTRPDATADETNIIPVTDVPFDELQIYDREMFPAPRETFLRGWIQMPDSHGLAIVEDDKLTGYAVIRHCWTGYKVGPLFADTPDNAEILFLALCSRIPEGEDVVLDTPEINPPAVRLAEKYGLGKVFETARMYNKYEPEINLSKIFGVTSFELG